MLKKSLFTAIILCSAFIEIIAINKNYFNAYNLSTIYNFLICGDSTTTETYNKENFIIQHDSLHEVTIIEDFIIYHNMIKQNSPKTYFETEANRALLSFITNMYLFHKSPYDTCWSLGYGNSKLINSFRNDFNGVDFAEYDNKYIDMMMQHPEIIQVKHGDFWNEIYRINKEFANPNGWALIEKAIKEAQTAFGLDKDDTIFIRKETLNEHQKVLEDIFTNMKSKINPIYLK